MLDKPINPKYINHVLQSRLLNFTDRSKFIKLPVCMKCERLCMYDRKPYDPPPVYKKDEFGNIVKSKPMVTCPYCGYHGPGGPEFRLHAKEV